MVETRRSSASASKRSFSSTTSTSSSIPKRSKSDRPKKDEAPPVQPDQAAAALAAEPERPAQEGDAADGLAPQGCTAAEAEELADRLAPLDLPAKRSGKSQQKVTWAKLLSQVSKNPHLNICSSIFTVGQSRMCNLRLEDPSVSTTLCKVKRIEHGGAPSALLEISGSKGVVLVNGKCLGKNSKIILAGGDEVVFSSSGKYAYIFQQLTNESLNTPLLPSSLGISDAVGAPLNGIQFGNRSGDPSAFDGASILASLSNPRNDGSVIASPASNDENVQQGLERPTPSFPELDSYCHVLKGCSELNGNTGIPSADNTAAAVSADLLSNDLFHLGSSTSELDLSGSVLKAFEDPRELQKNLDPRAPLPTSKSQAFKDSLKQGIVHVSDIEVSFDTFPYYLSDDTKSLLLSCAFIHLECKEFTKYTSNISSVNNRILLSGPTGSEIYQETLTKALAKHFGARLLIIDSLALPGVPLSKESESLKEGGKIEKTGIFSKQRAALADTLHFRKPASSVEADILGGTSIFNCQCPLKQEASTASSKSYTFKEGDRVRYVGSSHLSGFPIQTQRGPNFGYRGKVLLSFEGNRSSKIGVRFDRQIPEGNDLGGLCEGDHGFFCAANLLRPDTSGIEDYERLAIKELLDVVTEEIKNGPLIIFIRDIEKSMAGSTDSYLSLKGKLDFPPGVLVIGSHTQVDSRKEKSHPGGLLFTKFGSNQTALLDFAFPDSFGRLHERSKEVPKTTKQLTRLFPNKISIQLPQDEAQLSDWKQQLDRDVETLKAKSNIFSIRAFLTRSGLECNDLEKICIKDQSHTNENVDKIVGFALSHHLKHNATESSSKDAKIVLSSESITHGLSMLQNIQSDTKCSKKALKDVATENEFEKRLLADVIPPSDIGVTFDDIGALDNVKDTLKELVMLPLQRPELFSKGQLAKPCKGILLFGPPGTGKTMLAKAVATEAGANFINISMSSITSKWFGEGEKYVKAVFSLASKIAPSVVFVDEVDSMLGRRENPGEHEAMRKMKNEFMMNWDGLRTKDKERVLVLAATNRPFDLDEAVINILRVRSLWEKEREKIVVEREEEEEAAAEAAGENLGADLGGDRCVGCDGCAVDEEKEKVVFDRDSFSKLLRRVSMIEMEIYAKMSYLGSLAYTIPNIKPASLLRYHGLRFVTSSFEKKAKALNAEKEKAADTDRKPEEELLPDKDIHLESSAIAEDNEKQGENSSGINPSTAYHIAASAASFLHSQTKSILPFGKAESEKNPSEAGRISDDEGGISCSEMASFVATTNSVTAVVAGKEEMKQAVAKDLNSAQSSPCEWFICDDDKSGTRYFVIQGSESLASWQANLLFEPIQFEGLDVLVHRGIYEAAKGIYQQMLPEVKAHLKARGDSATLRFTGHSLGGSLSLLVNLMLLIRGEAPSSVLLPVITFGAPTIMCGGDYLLRKLGLPQSHVQAITMHRDIVPRAFSCNYPDHIARILKAVNGNFRNHPCLDNQKLLYAPMGKLLILQPEEKFSPHHDLLPLGSGLYLLGHPLADSDDSVKLLLAAQFAFLNSPHPLEILSDRAAYGAEGTVYRHHDMNSYLRSVRGVLRQELKLIRKAKREHRRVLWWPLVSAQGTEAIIGQRATLTNPTQHQFSFVGVFNGGKETFKRFGRIVASKNVQMFIVLLFPARLLVMGTRSMFPR